MRTDAQIQKDVTDQLKWEPWLNAAEIGVSVKDGVVTLTGLVDTYTKKIVAEAAVRKIAGVKAVAEDIQVGLSPGFVRTDAEIAAEVVNALKWHTAVMEDRIRIKVEGGAVTLEGEVEWNFQRLAAANAIQNLIGVRKVNNFIVVRPVFKPADIKREIVAAFHRSAALDGEKIKVEMRGEKVVLTGSVRSLVEKEDAEVAAWSAAGVKTVENDLKVEEGE
ncbi:MAG: BON domain-containing protein [Puia sp.]|nr:BON domain-containing protein [Puia sp.]